MGTGAVAKPLRGNKDFLGVPGEDKRLVREEDRLLTKEPGEGEGEGQRA